MSYKDASGDKVYTLDYPQLEGKAGYIGTFFTLYLRLGNMFDRPDFGKEPVKIRLFTKLIISMIPKKERRDTINKYIKERFEQLKKERTDTGIKLTDADIGYILIESALDGLGDVTDYIDKHVGINVENKVGFDICIHEKEVIEDET